jgi:hypothetical protein
MEKRPRTPRLVFVVFLTAVLLAALVGALVVGPLRQPAPELSTDPFAPTGLLRGSDSAANTALIPDGRVLIMNGDWVGMGTAKSVPEVWDPASSTVRRIGPTIHDRVGATATLLLDGRVLVIGGFAGPFAYSSTASATVEIWDPETEAFEETGSLSIGRVGHTATLLADGRVLVVGGSPPGSDSPTVELWDPSTGRFASAGELLTERSGHTATLLPDGQVMITGGTQQDGIRLGEVELWNPNALKSRRTNLYLDRPASATATRLLDGRVLLVGGAAFTDGSPSQFAFFASGRSVGDYVPTLVTARFGHAAVLLADGRVLILGGTVDGGASTASVEAFDPATETFIPAAPLPRPITNHTATLLTDGRILLVSSPGGPDEEVVDVYTPEPRN